MRIKKFGFEKEVKFVWQFKPFFGLFENLSNPQSYSLSNLSLLRNNDSVSIVTHQKNKIFRFLKSVIPTLLILISIFSLIRFSAFSNFNSNLNSNFSSYLSNIFSNNPQALAQNSNSEFDGARLEPNSPYFNNEEDSPYSIFANCFEAVNNNEYKIYFGYKNHTQSDINLSDSILPYGRKITNLANDKGTYYPNEKNIYSQLSLINQSEIGDQKTGYNPFYFAIQSYSTEDIVWQTKLKLNNQSNSEVIRTVRANPKYLPSCRKDSQNQLIDTFDVTENFESTPIFGINKIYLKNQSSNDFNKKQQLFEIKNKEEFENIKKIDPLKNIKIFTSCSEFETDQNGKGNNRYSTIFGYRNAVGSRLDLKTSRIFSRQDSIREIVHVYSDLKGENLKNLGLLNNSEFENSLIPEEKAKFEQSFKDSEIKDLNFENNFDEIKKYQSPIQYFYDGGDNVAMVVRGYGNGQISGGYSKGGAEDIIWSITKEATFDNKTYVFEKEVRSNPLFDEPCMDKPLIENNQTVASQDNSILSKKTAKSNNFRTVNSGKNNQENFELNKISFGSLINNLNPFGQLEVLAQESDLESEIDQVLSENTENTNPEAADLSSLLSTQELATNQNVEIKVLGGVNLEEYCDGFGGEFSFRLKQNDKTATGWECYYSYFLNMGSFTQICKSQYASNNESIAKYDNYNDPNSIYCMDTVFGIETTRLGGLNLAGYCENTFGSQYFIEVYGDNTVDSWRCTKSRNVEANKACSDQYPINSEKNPTPNIANSFSQNPSDPYSIECVVGIESNIDDGAGNNGGRSNGGGGTGQDPDGEILVDDDLEDDNVDIVQMSNEYFSENDVDITLDRNSQTVTGLIDQVAFQTFDQVRQFVFGDSNGCDEIISCGSIFVSVTFNMAKLVANFQIGIFQGIGQFFVDILDSIKTIANEGLEFITGIFNSITQLINNPSFFADSIMADLESFLTLDIFQKANKIGRAIGVLIPDIALLFVPGVGAAKVSAKILQVVDKTADFLRTSIKIANLAEKFVGKTLFLAIDVSVKVIKIGSRIAVKGIEMWDKIQSLPERAFIKLLDSITGPTKEIVQKIRGLLKSCNLVSKVTVPLTGLALLTTIFSPVGVEAAGNKRCFHNNGINGAKGERYVLSIIGGINNPKKRVSYTVGNKRFYRYPDIRDGVIEVDGKVIKIARATEVKTGFVTYSSKIEKQMLKDIELKRLGVYENVEWRILPNPQTGMVGIDSRLRTLLEDNGIKLIIDRGIDISNF
jgi:hypothetical protein